MRTVSEKGIKQAARAAGLTPKQIPAALDAFAAITPHDMAGMSDWGSDPANDWADLPAWKAAWGPVLGSLDDATASFVVALIVRRSGGVAV